MAFSQDTILEVYPAVPNGAGVTLEWRSSSPLGTVFQAYVNGKLQYHGTSTFCTIPRPPANSRVAIGTVGAGEGSTDFSASLPPAPRSRAVLTWSGGSFEAADLLGFRVFGEITAGGGVDYTTPLADIQAFVEGAEPIDMTTSTFTWASDNHKTGSWTFAVVPYDLVGNLGTALTTTVDLVSAPAEVPFRSTGQRLNYTYSQITKQITIVWDASEG